MEDISCSDEEQLELALEEVAAMKLEVETAKQEVAAAEQQVVAVKQEVIAAEQRVEAAEQRVEAAEQQVEAAEQQVEAAKLELEDRIKEKADESLIKLSEDSLNQAVEKLNRAVEKLNRAVEKLNRALEEKNGALEEKKHAVDNLYDLRRHELAQRPLKRSDDFNRAVANSPSIRAATAMIGMLHPQIENPWVLDDKNALIACNDSKSYNSDRDRNLRNKVANHYRCKKIQDKVCFATCCVTQEIGDHRQVICAHLLPRSAPRKYLEDLDFDDDEPKSKQFDDFRNLVLLAKNIEAAFDRQRLCFLMNDNGELVMHLLDPDLKDEPIFSGSDKTIGNYDGAVMTFNENYGGERPFTRVLSFHAQCSYIKAKREGWIPKSESQPDEYGSPLRGDLIRSINRHRSFPRDSDLTLHDETEATVHIDSDELDTSQKELLWPSQDSCCD